MWVVRLGYFDVLSLPALGAFHDVEAYRLAFLEAAESIALDCRVMNENILTALTADKTESLCIVEPLYRSLFHDFFLAILMLVPPNTMWSVCESV
jgi:hypothetical protein